MDVCQNQMSSDKPISSKEEDLLNRHPFAQNLANVIKEWKQQRSLVIALYGKWGSGKTSLKNLIVKSLQEDNEKKPYIVEFNPWQYSNNELLSAMFFHEIGSVLDQTNTSPAESEKNKNLASNWKKYASVMRLASIGTKALGVFVPGASFAGDILAGGASAAEEGSKAMTAKAEQKLSLFDLKEQLDKDLKQLDKPILVIIDDVDRLSSDEIVLLFQLIKANGNFHNLIYLIMCQRSFVEKALEKLALGLGREFLEKIVQVPFDIPMVSRETLKKELYSKLISLGKGFDDIDKNDLLNKLYNKSLKYYFETMRDINRFINTLSFHIVLLSLKGVLEVNEVDLIALEVLRVFEQGVYEKIPVIKDSLIIHSSGNGIDIQDNETINNNLASLKSSANQENLLEMVGVLQYLFPHLDFGYQSKKITEEMTTKMYIKKGLENRRVYHEDYFDRYFQLVIPNDSKRINNLDKLLSLSCDTYEIPDFLEQMRKEDLLGSILVDLRYSIRNNQTNFNTKLLAIVLSFGEEKFNDALIPVCQDPAKLVPLMFFAKHSENGKNDNVATHFDDFKNNNNIDPFLNLLDEIEDFVIDCRFSEESLVELIEGVKGVFILHKIMMRKHGSSFLSMDSTLAIALRNKFDELVEKKNLVMSPFLANCFDWRISLIKNEVDKEAFIRKFVENQFDIIGLISVMYNLGKTFPSTIKFDYLRKCVEPGILNGHLSVISSHTPGSYHSVWKSYSK